MLKHPNTQIPLIGRNINLELHQKTNAHIARLVQHPSRPHKLDVIIQTHSVGNSQEGIPRYCGMQKSEIMLRCVTSLVRALNAAGSHIDAQLVILDDHSSAKSLDALRSLQARLRYPSTLVSLSTRGIMPSIEACYRWGLEKNRGGLVYFVQDDYLFSPSAIEEMVDAYHRFRYMLGGKEVGIFPFDDPYRYYAPINVEPTRVVYGSKRHWRMNFFSPSTFMVSHEVVRRHWPLFETLARAPIGPTMEDDTINRIWKENHVVLFTPIPSLALHLQHETEKDPFMDWKKWWDEAGAELRSEGR